MRLIDADQAIKRLQQEHDDINTHGIDKYGILTAMAEISKEPTVCYQSAHQQGDGKDSRMESQDAAKAYKKLMCGKCYRHFKGTVYRVITVGVHSETAELMVCYAPATEQPFIKPQHIWIRPLDMFLSPVDKKKYPDAEQEMRFELVDNESEASL